MYKHLLIAALGVSIAVAGFLLFARSAAHAPAPYQAPSGMPDKGAVDTAAHSTDPYDIEIIFNGEGYAPGEITVKKGTRVRFSNTSNVPTWPASGVHPTHSLYPEKGPTDCLGSSFDS